MTEVASAVDTVEDSSFFAKCQFWSSWLVNMQWGKGSMLIFEILKMNNDEIKHREALAHRFVIITDENCWTSRRACFDFVGDYRFFFLTVSLCRQKFFVVHQHFRGVISSAEWFFFIYIFFFANVESAWILL